MALIKNWKTRHITCAILVYLVLISSTSAQSFSTSSITKFLSNIGHGLHSMVTGSRVTLQGSAGPSSLGLKFVSRDVRDIRYFLYSNRLNMDEKTELFLGDTKNFNLANFDKEKPVKILIHGFNRNSTAKRFPQDTKNAYLNSTDHNVIVVEWGKLSTPVISGKSQGNLLYPVVVENVPIVGENVGKFIMFLMEAELISSVKQVHLVGFSLGAHVSGLAGQYVKRHTSEKLARITGLDPAGPLFKQAEFSERLDQSDAEFVDIVHSSKRLGLYEDIGHIDFYPNGNLLKRTDSTGPFQSLRQYAQMLTLSGSCDHSRAAEYFTYSILQGPDKITACKCTSWKQYLSTCKNNCEDEVTFGEYCPPTARGKYFLEINIPVPAKCNKNKSNQNEEESF